MHSFVASLPPESVLEVGVLPLGNTVLFPQVVLPLQTSEDAACRLLRDCSQGSRRLVVTCAAPNAPGGVCHVGCLAQLLQIEPANAHAAGEVKVLLRGEARVQLLQEHTPTAGYRRFAVRPLPHAAKSEPRQSHSHAVLHQYLCALGKAAASVDKPLAEVLRASADPWQVADFLAASVVRAPERQQAALQSDRYEARMAAMGEGLAEALLKLLGPQLAASRRH